MSILHPYLPCTGKDEDVHQSILLMTPHDWFSFRPPKCFCLVKCYIVSVFVLIYHKKYVRANRWYLIDQVYNAYDIIGVFRSFKGVYTVLLRGIRAKWLSKGGRTKNPWGIHAEIEGHSGASSNMYFQKFLQPWWWKYWKNESNWEPFRSILEYLFLKFSSTMWS